MSNKVSRRLPNRQADRPHIVVARIGGRVVTRFSTKEKESAHYTRDLLIAAGVYDAVQITEYGRS